MPQPSPPARTSDLPDLPPPAPSAGALAWLRWAIAVLKATTGPNRVAIRRHRAPTGGTESLGTVAIAISTDLAMSVAKAVAAALTGSAGLFAETLHALADTGNQLLLLKGPCGSRRRPDTSHPFRLRRRALLLVTAGGPQHLCPRRRPVPAAPALHHRHRGHGRLLRRRSGAARQRDRPHRARLAPAPRLPGARCGCRDRDGPAAGGHRAAASGTKLRPADHRDLLVADPEVAAVGPVASVYLGPHQLLVTAEIQPLDAISGLRLRQLLGELRGRVTAVIPRAAHVVLTPVVTVEQPPEPTPWDRDYWLRRFPDQEQA
jgi:Cation efflux family